MLAFGLAFWITALAGVWLVSGAGAWFLAGKVVSKFLRGYARHIVRGLLLAFFIAPWSVGPHGSLFLPCYLVFTFVILSQPSNMHHLVYGLGGLSFLTVAVLGFLGSAAFTSPTRKATSDQSRTGEGPPNPGVERSSDT